MKTSNFNFLHLFAVVSIDINDCHPYPCENGGTCIDQVNDYECRCIDAFVGKNCSTYTAPPGKWSSLKFHYLGSNILGALFFL